MLSALQLFHDSKKAEQMAKIKQCSHTELLTVYRVPSNFPI